MLVAAPLGGFREDAIDVLSIAVGQSRARSFVSGLEQHIRQEARAGAEQAIPTIRSEVKTEATSAVKPWVIAALAVSGVAAAGVGYLWWRRRR